MQFLYLQCFLQNFSSKAWFLKLLPCIFCLTSLLQCWTALYWSFALHCTALTYHRWYIDMWNVNPPPLCPSVCMSIWILLIYIAITCYQLVEICNLMICRISVYEKKNFRPITNTNLLVLIFFGKWKKKTVSFEFFSKLKFFG